MNKKYIAVGIFASAGILLMYQLSKKKEIPETPEVPEVEKALSIPEAKIEMEANGGQLVDINAITRGEPARIKLY